MRITSRQLRQIIREEIVRESNVGNEPVSGDTKVQSGSAATIKQLLDILQIDDNVLSTIVAGLKAGDKRNAAQNQALAIAFEKLVELDPANTSQAASLLKKIKTEDK